MRWNAGEAEVERLLAAGHVERVQGAQAAQALQTAADIIDAAAQLVPNLGFF